MGKMKLVELSHPFGADMPVWPYFAKPVLTLCTTCQNQVF